MPVSLEDWRARKPLPVREGSIAARALALLRGTPGQVWRPVEIARKLRVEQTTLSPQLSRLRARGLVENENGGWYALDDAEVAKAVAMRMATRATNERLGTENPKDWIDTPQD